MPAAAPVRKRVKVKARPASGGAPVKVRRAAGTEDAAPAKAGRSSGTAKTRRAKAERPQRERRWRGPRWPQGLTGVRAGDLASVALLTALCAGAITLHELHLRAQEAPVANLAQLSAAEREHQIYQELKLVRSSGESVQRASARIARRYGADPDQIIGLLWKGDTEGWGR